MRYTIRSTMDACMIVQMHTQLIEEARSRGHPEINPLFHIENGRLHMETGRLQTIAPATLRNWKDYLTEVWE